MPSSCPFSVPNTVVVGARNRKRSDISPGISMRMDLLQVILDLFCVYQYVWLDPNAYFYEDAETHSAGKPILI